jgi:hypothetical protein
MGAGRPRVVVWTTEPSGEKGGVEPAPAALGVELSEAESLDVKEGSRLGQRNGGGEPHSAEEWRPRGSLRGGSAAGSLTLPAEPETAQGPPP